MEGKIESLLENAISYINILHSCRTDRVSKWTRKDLEKAIKWGKHFQNVYNKLSRARPYMKEQFTVKFNTQLSKYPSLKSTSQQWPQCYEPHLLSLQFLGTKSLQYMIKCLLENPSLCHEEVQYVPELMTAASEYCISYADSQSLLETLKNINSMVKLDDHKNEGNIPAVIPTASSDSIVSAVALMEELKIVKRTSHDDVHSYNITLTERLNSILSINEGMEVILTTLTLKDDDHCTVMSLIQGDIIVWLRERLHENISTLKHLLSLPVHTLTYTADKCPLFLNLYIKQLIFITDHTAVISNTATLHHTAADEHSISPPMFEYSTESDITLYWIALSQISVTCQQKCFEVIKEREVVSLRWKKLGETLKKRIV